MPSESLPVEVLQPLPPPLPQGEREMQSEEEKEWASSLFIFQAILKHPEGTPTHRGTFKCTKCPGMETGVRGKQGTALPVLVLCPSNNHQFGPFNAQSRVSGRSS